MVKKMWAGLLGNFGFAVKIHLKKEEGWMKQGLIKKLQKNASIPLRCFFYVVVIKNTTTIH